MHIFAEYKEINLYNIIEKVQKNDIDKFKKAEEEVATNSCSEADWGKLTNSWVAISVLPLAGRNF